MKVIQCIVSQENFRRFLYTRTHTTGLLQRFSQLLKTCKLNDSFSSANFDAVNIYVFSENEDGSIENLTKENFHVIKCNHYQNPPAIKFKEEEINVCVAACREAQRESSEVWQFFGDTILLITAEEEHQNAADNVLHHLGTDTIFRVCSSSNYSAELDKLLERIVFKHLYWRVCLLRKFSELNTNILTTGNLIPLIKNLLDEKFQQLKDKDKREEIFMNEIWHSAKLDIITAKVNEIFGEEFQAIKDQLLTANEDFSWDHFQRNSSKIPKHIKFAPVLPNATLIQVDANECKQKAELIAEKLNHILKCVNTFRGEILQLYGECLAMYLRSSVPLSDIPAHQFFPTLDKEVVREILRVHGVKGCGYRFYVLDIFLSNDLSKEEQIRSEKKLRDIANNHAIRNIKLHKNTKDSIKFGKYDDVRTGTKIHSRTATIATLGCFARHGDHKQLCLLLAKHLATAGDKIYIHSVNNTSEHIATVLRTHSTGDFQAGRAFDIAAADILKCVEQKCVTEFLDSQGADKNGKLIDFNAVSSTWLYGLPVHIWGAGVGLGRGIISCPEFYISESQKLVQISDYENTEMDYESTAMYASGHFAAPGDSGAVVCADDVSGEFVHIVSMLIGSMVSESKTFYVSFRLQDGIRQLETDHLETFTICSTI